MKLKIEIYAKQIPFLKGGAAAIAVAGVCFYTEKSKIVNLKSKICQC